MKRFVRADIISATLITAAAVLSSSCTWTEDRFKKDKQEEGQAVETAIPMDQVLSVADLVSGRFAGDTVWVQGYIVGGLTAAGAVDFDCDTALTATALLLADSTGCRTPEECAVLNLTKAAHKKVLGLDNPANKPTVFHRKIFAQGKATTYKKRPALTNLCQYQLE